MTTTRRLLVLASMLGLALSTSSASAASLALTSQNLTPYRTCIISGFPATTTAVRDASVRQATATTNFGTQSTNDVASSNAANRRLYLRIDLTICAPAIPASATVRLATLRLYASVLPAACRTLDLFPATAAWTEAGITWNNQPFGTTANNPATGSRTASFDIGTPVGCANRVAGFAPVTVTSDVAAWVAGSSTNNGWMIRDDTENSSTARTTTFSAKDLATASQAPELVVSYVTVP